MLAPKDGLIILVPASIIIFWHFSELESTFEVLKTGRDTLKKI